MHKGQAHVNARPKYFLPKCIYRIKDCCNYRVLKIGLKYFTIH